MRQVGSLPDKQGAQRFVAYLITQQIDAQAEQDDHQWVIWVKDENRVDRAREMFIDFRCNPQAERYRGAEKLADQIIQQELQKKLEARKHVVQMRGQWAQPTARRAPLTMTMLLLSILVTIVGDCGSQLRGIGGTVNSTLVFCSNTDYKQRNDNPLASIAKGQVWRVITPIFMHLSWMHLAFNMIMFFQFGGMVESRRSTLLMAGLVLAIAVSSNLAQAVFPTEWGGSPFFGGMSGVVYGLFGYVWMQAAFNPRSQFFLSSVTVVVLVGWLFLCMTGSMGPVANVAHVVGLLVGMGIGYLPTVWARAAKD